MKLTMGRGWIGGITVFAAFALAGVADAKHVPLCSPGQRANASTKYHCCWPGQAWDDATQLCQGIPTSCPAGMAVRDERCERQFSLGPAPAPQPDRRNVKCGLGERASAETQWHCCWPGQTWHPTRLMCVGTPDACPKGRVPEGDNCVAARAAPPPAAAKPEKRRENIYLTPTDEKHLDAMVGHEEKENLPQKIEGRTIVAVMSSLKPAVHECAVQHGGKGVAMMAIVVAGEDGLVQSATMTGSLNGTPTGECVAKLVRGAAFPRFRLKQQALAYPITVQ